MEQVQIVMLKDIILFEAKTMKTQCMKRMNSSLSLSKFNNFNLYT